MPKSEVDIRNAKILKRRGRKSFGLIAKELGLTRNIVAGVCFRADHPPHTRIPSPGSHGANKIGTGHRGGPWARRRLPVGGAAYKAKLEASGA